jgi:membrane protein
MHLKKQFIRFLSVWNAADATTYGAAVAYYTVFSLAPILLIAISAAALLVERSQVEMSVIEQFRNVFGDTGASFVMSLVDARVPHDANIALAVGGILVTVVGATGVFSGLQSGLDALFTDLPKKKSDLDFWKMVLKRIYSLGMVLSLGFVLVVSLTASAFLTAFSRAIDDVVPGGIIISTLVDFVFSFVLISLFLGCLLKLLPSERIAWVPALKGGLIAGALFVVGKFALALYLGSSSIVSAYGAASSIVLLILWTYYLSLAFFLSAIVTRLYFIKNK